MDEYLLELGISDVLIRKFPNENSLDRDEIKELLSTILEVESLIIS